MNNGSLPQAEPESIVMSPQEFLRFRDFMYEKIGVIFTENKRYFVDKRVAERASQRNCSTFSEYFSLLRFDRDNTEMQQMVNLLTVNETYFLREKYQFTTLVDHLLPEIAARKARSDKIRIWSMPCSTGEEPYTIAISILEGWAQSDEFQIEIIGSDIDTRVLEESREGIYNERSLQNVSEHMRRRYFQKINNNSYRVIQELRDSIEFTQVNLNDQVTMASMRDIDIIFCRNLLIYFDDISRRDAIASMYQSMSEGGFILLGHSESMSRISSAFITRKLGESIVYQRKLRGR